MNLLNSLKPASCSIATVIFRGVILIGSLSFSIIEEVATVFFLAGNITDVVLIGGNYAKSPSTIIIGVYPKHTSLAL